MSEGRFIGRKARRRDAARRNAIRSRFHDDLRPARPKDKAARKEAKRKEKELKPDHPAIKWYQGVCYDLLGERLDDKKRRKLEEKIKQADYSISPGLYLAMNYITAALALPLGLVVIGGIAVVANGLAGLRVALILSAVLAVMALAAFPFTLKQRITNRKVQLEKELPFSLSELSVLATIGMSPIQLMNRMAERSHDPAMTTMFKRVTTKTNIQGMDIVGALAATARESPSPLLREVLWDMGNMMHQGGDLGPYLKTKSDDMLEVKRNRQKAFTDQLGGFAEMFVTVVLVGTIFLGIGTFMMDAFGIDANGLGAAQVLMLLAYGFIPVVCTVVGILVTSAYSQVQ